MKSISVILILFILFTTCARTSDASPKQGQPGGRAEKVKSSLGKLGVGESARVEVKLRDGTRLKGYIREAGEDSFVVVDRKTGVANAVTYEQVEKIKGRGLSTGAKVAIGFGIVAAVLGMMALIGLHYAD